MRIILEACHQRFHLAVQRDQGSNFCGGEQAVTGRAVVEKNDVPGLFASERRAAAKHLFKDIAVAHGGAGQRNVFAGQRALQTQIGHGGGHDAVTFQLILRLEEARGGQKHAVTIHDFSAFRDKQRAVGITVKAHTETRFFSDDALPQAVQVQRTAAGVDVPAVR